MYKLPKDVHLQELLKALIRDTDGLTYTFISNSSKYSGAAKEKPREWLGLYEDYFTLRSRKFIKEKSKVLWAHFATKES